MLRLGSGNLRPPVTQVSVGAPDKFGSDSSVTDLRPEVFQNFRAPMQVGFSYFSHRTDNDQHQTYVTPSKRPLSFNIPVLRFSTNKYRGCRYLISSRARSTIASALASSLGLYVTAALYSVQGENCNCVKISWIKCYIIILIQYIHKNVWLAIDIKIENDAFQALLFKSLRCRIGS